MDKIILHNFKLILYNLLDLINICYEAESEENIQNIELNDIINIITL